MKKEKDRRLVVHMDGFQFPIPPAILSKRQFKALKGANSEEPKLQALFAFAKNEKAKAMARGEQPGKVVLEPQEGFGAAMRIGLEDPYYSATA